MKQRKPQKLRMKARAQHSYAKSVWRIPVRSQARQEQEHKRRALWP